MDTERLLRTVLDLPSPWQIDDVELDDEDQRVNVKVSFSKSRGPCPKCAEEGPRHDVRRRSWRRQASLDPFFEGLSTEQLSDIKTVAMDMHDPFINSAAWHIPDIESKL